VSKTVYKGYFIPGANTHGDTDGPVILATDEEVASLLQADRESLTWFDHGAGTAVVRRDMQLDDNAPVNSAATKMMSMTTTVGLTIRGPMINFPRGNHPLRSTRQEHGVRDTHT